MLPYYRGYLLVIAKLRPKKDFYMALSWQWLKAINAELRQIIYELKWDGLILYRW